MDTATKATPLPSQYRFAAGARERFAGTFKDQSVALGASAQALDLIDIAAGDFTAGVYLHVTAAATGNAAAVAFQADGPFSALQQVELLDPTGVAFQTYSGYELMILNALGGYTGQSIPTDSPNYTTTTGAVGTGGSFGFMLRIPCELFPRDGAAALWNGSTAAQFKVRVTIAPSTAIYSVAPTALPSVRVRVNSHGYQVASGPSLANVPFQQTPPGGQMYQNVYRQVYQIAGAGQIIVPLSRKGYLLRELIFIVRDNAGARSSTVLGSTDWNVKIDNVDVFLGSDALLRQITWERNRYTSGSSLPAGVYGLTWAFDWDGLNGGESRDQYVPTQPGSIMELRTTAAAAGSVTILTNDVSVTREAVDQGIVRV